MLKLFLISAFFISIPRINAQTFRLPNNTRPESYLVKLEFNNFEFNLVFIGASSIKIYVEEDTNLITLHSAVEIENVTLCSYYDSCDDTEISETSHDIEREFFQITTAQTLRKGSNFYLNFRFSGRIFTMTENVTGIYRGSYTPENGTLNFFLATHMQATHARKVFPCYDEPKFKAKFHLTLIHSNQYHSISNMNVANEVLSPNQVTRSFEVTPLLPTYLLAFVISKFPVKNETSNGIEFRAFSREEQLKNMQFSIQTAIKALKEFEELFNMTYEGMKKLDQVALPIFNLGGMENHGIIIYREDFILYDENVNTTYEKEYVALSVVHEVCHTFFGNLLTPHWWSVLWLSEGFCEFYEYYMMESIYADMRLEESFLSDILQDEMIHDAASSVRPMTFYVETPSEIREIFDTVTYSKAACVIRMFFYALTPEIFHDGVNKYLSKITSNPQGVAEPQHFYDALQMALPESSNIRVREFFESWEHQAGFPYVQVERNYNGNQTRFTQRRFFDSDEDSNSTWHIPITYSTDVEDLSVVNNFWMNSRQGELNIQGLRPNNILLLNINQHGYYRVLYDTPNWSQIGNFLYEKGFSLISPTTRSMLIDDAAVFVEYDMLDIRVFFNLIKHLEKDDDWIPWVAASYHLEYMRNMLDDGSSKIYYDFRKFIRKITAKTYKTYGAEALIDEPHHHKHIRNIAINWACQAHLPECLNDTEELFTQTVLDSSFELSLDHKYSIMCYGVVNATQDTFEYLWNLYTSTQHSADDTLILNTIGCIEDEEILTQFIRKYNATVGSDWLTMIKAVYTNGPIGMNVAMQFLRNNFDEFSKFITIGSHQPSLNSIFTEIANRVTTGVQFDEHVALMEMYEIPEETQTLAISTMSYNLEWIEDHSRKIQEFLDDYLRDYAERIVASWLIAVMMIAVKFTS